MPHCEAKDTRTNMTTSQGTPITKSIVQKKRKATATITSNNNKSEESGDSLIEEMAKKKRRICSSSSTFSTVKQSATVGSTGNAPSTIVRSECLHQTEMRKIGRQIVAGLWKVSNHLEGLLDEFKCMYPYILKSICRKKKLYILVKTPFHIV